MILQSLADFTDSVSDHYKKRLSLTVVFYLFGYHKAAFA